MVEPTKIRAVRGVRDILPPDTALWNRVEQTARDVFESYNFREIRLPIFEPTELFARSVGADTDIVSKEMYTFRDEPEDHFAILRDMILDPGWKADPQKERELEQRARESKVRAMISLRPEATASVVRAYIEHGMQTRPQPVKLYYLGPMFRRERPQKGRYRQFYQIGAEVLGSNIAHFSVDAEVIAMLMAFFMRCGLRQHTLFINSMGCRDCRPAYIKRLRTELRKVKNRLGADSQRRIETNPLRVLDSKVPQEHEIIECLPALLDSLCPACREHFEGLKKSLQARGVSFEANPRLVRGLDYYVRTTFEVTAPGLGSQDAVCGGGRYDGLVGLLGGAKFKDVKGVGFAIGEDRLIESLQHLGVTSPERPDVLIAWKDEASRDHAEKVAGLLRDSGLSVEIPAKPMSPGEGLGLANRLGIPIGVVVGPGEASTGTFGMRFLAEGEQVSVKPAQLGQLGLMLKFRILLEKELQQLATVHALQHKNLSPTTLADRLVEAGTLQSDVGLLVKMAMDTFNKLVHGQEVGSTQLAEAVAASVRILDELSGHAKAGLRLG